MRNSKGAGKVNLRQTTLCMSNSRRSSLRCQSNNSDNKWTSSQRGSWTWFNGHTDTAEGYTAFVCLFEEAVMGQKTDNNICIYV